MAATRTQNLCKYTAYEGFAWCSAFPAVSPPGGLVLRFRFRSTSSFFPILPYRYSTFLLLNIFSTFLGNIHLSSRIGSVPNTRCCVSCHPELTKSLHPSALPTTSAFVGHVSSSYNIMKPLYDLLGAPHPFDPTHRFTTSVSKLSSYQAHKPPLHCAL